MILPKTLRQRLCQRKKQNNLRTLFEFFSKDLIDFASNDYLGLAKEKTIHQEAERLLEGYPYKNGSTASRLLCGSHPIHRDLEIYLSGYYQTQEALLFNSGYDANVGLLSAILNKHSVVLYDRNIHASMRDGIRMSVAKAYKFEHNDWRDLQRKFKNVTNPTKDTYIVIESVYSMDGDIAPLREFAEFAEQNNAYLIVDEAHSNGVFGKGLVAQLHLESKIWARVCTFGKAFGVHGAVVLGSKILKEYLINFARSFIYTTAMAPYSAANILAAHQYLQKNPERQVQLHQKMALFRNYLKDFGLCDYFIPSQSPIQSCIISGNDKVRNAAQYLQQKGFGVYPILSPTVPKGKERLRICLHSFNTQLHIEQLMGHLASLVL